METHTLNGHDAKKTPTPSVEVAEHALTVALTEQAAAAKAATKAGKALAKASEARTRAKAAADTADAHQATCDANVTAARTALRNAQAKVS